MRSGRGDQLEVDQVSEHLRVDRLIVSGFDAGEHAPGFGAETPIAIGCDIEHDGAIVEAAKADAVVDLVLLHAL
jgi:hypothetical protein